MSTTKYTLGLDYGTNSVRALIVDVANGREIATAVWNYAHGTQGVILSRDPNLARQHPADYVKGAEMTIRKALAQAGRTVRGFKPAQVIGIGVDTTGSTPIPGGQQRPAAGLRQAIRQRPRRDGLAVEGPHRRGRGRGNHRPGAQDAPAIPRQVRRHLLQRMVLQQDPALLPHQPRSFRRRPHLGRMRRLGSRHAHRHRGAGQAHGRRLRRRPQGDVQRAVGRLSRRGVPVQTRSPSSATSAPACVPRLMPSTAPSAA